MNKDTLKKKIIYMSKHRGTKEMDFVLGAFVDKYIDIFNDSELDDLETLLNIDDEILFKWYFDLDLNKGIPKNKVSQKLKSFKP